MADTSALPRGAVGPWWEQSFLLPIMGSAAEHPLARSGAIGTNPTARYPVLLAEVRALHEAAVGQPTAGGQAVGLLPPAGGDGLSDRREKFTGNTLG